MLYSTYLGGSTEDEARSIAVDVQGNAYITGVTLSDDFPLQNALQSRSLSHWTAFVTKLSPDGSKLVYSTYLGGSSLDEAWGIAVDTAGNAYVTGQTLSKNFPTVNAVQPNHGGGPQCINFCDKDAFVSVVSADGSKLVYSTYLGGGNNDIGYGIAVDAGGNAYVAGETASPDFPLSHPIQAGLRGRIDGFVARLSPGGKSLVYSTYLGGSGDDSGRAIAVDQAGNAYVTGGTISTDFPLAAPIQPSLGGGSNAFVSKLAADGSGLIYSTYLGGSLPFALYLNPGPIPDGGSGIAVDRRGNAYVTGAASSIDFPLLRPLDVARPKGVVRSTDGGATWTGGSTGLAGALTLGNSLQVDRQNPANLYLATQGGVYKSTDGGFHWSVTGLRSAVSSLAIDPQLSTTLYAGTQGFARSTDGGASWTTDPSPGQTLAVAVDPANPAVVYRGGSLTLLRSADRGASWNSVYGGLPTTLCGDSPSSCVGVSVITLAVDPVTTSTIYAGVRETSIGPLPKFIISKPLYKRVGTTWTAVSNGLPLQEVAAVAVDPGNPNRLYAGLATGLFRSTDGGGSWASTSIAVPVESLLIDPTTSTVYAGVRGGVMRSGDGGNTWVATGLDKTTVKALALDTTGSTLYAVADSGNDVFVTEINAAGSAFVYSTTLGGADVDYGASIALDARANVYVTGTTQSTDFPAFGALESGFPANVFQQSAFAAKISARGRRSSAHPRPEER